MLLAAHLVAPTVTTVTTVTTTVCDNVPSYDMIQVIASLRRELDVLEHEAVGAKTQAAEEESRRVELQVEIDALRYKTRVLATLECLQRCQRAYVYLF